MADLTDFNGEELQLPYTEWKALTDARRNHLETSVRRWLYAWELVDLALSPMNDDERRSIRYGHYLGWFDGINARGVSVADDKTNARQTPTSGGERG